MPRVKRGVVAGARHKKILKLTKGHYGARSRVFRVAKQSAIKAGQYAYIGRKLRKRDFRSLWITRINAACREVGLSYSKFIHGLKLINIDIDRKMMAELAVMDKSVFAELASKATQALAK